MIHHILPRAEIGSGYLAFLLVASSACSESPDRGQARAVGAAGASGTSGGQTSAGGAAGSTGGSQPTGGAAGAQPTPGPDCSRARPGPAMVRIDRPQTGDAYCMDSRETTQAEYALFLAKVPSAPSEYDSDPWCKANDHQGYAARFRPFSDTIGPGCGPASAWDPVGRSGWPVTCVDQCDASAYCAWAGKRLCGMRDGAKAETASTEGPVPQSASSEWAYACAEGKVDGIIGTKRDPQCTSAKTDTGAASYPADVETRKGCVGRTPPFNDIQDLEGNATEWTAECSAAGAAEPFCLTRGPGSTSPERGSPDTVCPVQYVRGVSNVATDLGIRCCAD